MTPDTNKVLAARIVVLLGAVLVAAPHAAGMAPVHAAMAHLCGGLVTMAGVAGFVLAQRRADGRPCTARASAGARVSHRP